jgi:hypothetical protein
MRDIERTKRSGDQFDGAESFTKESSRAPRLEHSAGLKKPANIDGVAYPGMMSRMCRCEKGYRVMR